MGNDGFAAGATRYLHDDGLIYNDTSVPFLWSQDGTTTLFQPSHDLDTTRSVYFPHQITPDGLDATYAKWRMAVDPTDPGSVWMTGYFNGSGTQPPQSIGLFHSANGGATWEQLTATGYVGGAVLLAPSFPADPRIFVAGPNALQLSTDGGKTFTTVAPLGGAAAMSPAFSNGDPRILLGAVPGWEYNDAAATVRSLPYTARALSGSPDSSAARPRA